MFTASRQGQTLKHVPSSGQNSRQLNHASAPGMSYPQFVEVLSLLASSAAGRLRSLYPDVAGAEPVIRGDGALSEEEPVVGESASSRGGVAGAIHGNISALETESPGVSEGSGKHARRQNDEGGIAHRHTGQAHAASRLRVAR